MLSLVLQLLGLPVFLIDISIIDRMVTFKIENKKKWLFTVAFLQRTGDTVSVILYDHMISTVSYGSGMSLLIYQQWVSNSFPGD